MNNKEAVEKVDKAIKSEFFKRCRISNDLAEALGIVVGLATKATDNDTHDKPIADLINREALKDVIKPYKGKAISTQFILDIIDKAPPVDVSGSEYFPYRTAYFNGVRDGRATARPKGEAENLDYQRAVEDTEYCERHEPTYNSDDGSM